LLSRKNWAKREPKKGGFRPLIFNVSAGYSLHILRLEESLKLTKTGGVTHLAESLGLNLSDTLTGNLELLANLLKCP
jgi:hypothetical protein